MKRIKVVNAARIVFFAGAAAAMAAASQITITEPSRDGVTAGCRVTVHGKAGDLKPGEHVWLFAARSNFAELGLVWLQGPAEVDPQTKEFSGQVVLGSSEDIGANFRISAAVVNEETHAKLRAKFIEMMSANRHVPVPFPPTLGPPVHLTVHKVSNEGC